MRASSVTSKVPFAQPRAWASVCQSQQRPQPGVDRVDPIVGLARIPAPSETSSMSVHIVGHRDVMAARASHPHHVPGVDDFAVLLGK